MTFHEVLPEAMANTKTVYAHDHDADNNWGDSVHYFSLKTNFSHSICFSRGLLGIYFSSLTLSTLRKDFSRRQI